MESEMDRKYTYALVDMTKKAMQTLINWLEKQDKENDAQIMEGILWEIESWQNGAFDYMDFQFETEGETK